MSADTGGVSASQSAAFLAALNGNGPKNMGARPLTILFALDGQPILRDYTGPLWVAFSCVGGKKGQSSFEAWLGTCPAQTSIGEFVAMNTQGIEGGGFVGAAPQTPNTGGGGAMMSMME